MNNPPSRQKLDANGHNATAALHEWGDDALRQEMQRLASGNRDLRAAVGLDNGSAEAHESEELQRLRGENAELRQRVEELEMALLERPEGEEDWGERQREYEALLEEKSEVIRSLHQKIQELREAATSAPSAQRSGGPIDPGAHQELLAMKREVEEARAQLEEDEQALMQQMRQMEMTMSRERAELARQRNELQRLHNDLRHEMEQAARDAELRERLQPLQRRQQEVTARRPSLVEIHVPAPEPLKPDNQAPNSKRPGSGLFRRIFGSKQE